MWAKRGLFFFGMTVAAFYLKDLAFPDLQSWPNVLLSAAIGGSIGCLSVLLIREKK